MKNIIKWNSSNTHWCVFPGFGEYYCLCVTAQKFDKLPQVSRLGLMTTNLKMKKKPGGVERTRPLLPTPHLCLRLLTTVHWPLLA